MLSHKAFLQVYVWGRDWQMHILQILRFKIYKMRIKIYNSSWLKTYLCPKDCARFETALVKKQWIRTPHSTANLLLFTLYIFHCVFHFWLKVFCVDVAYQFSPQPCHFSTQWWGLDETQGECTWIFITAFILDSAFSLKSNKRLDDKLW